MHAFLALKGAVYRDWSIPKVPVCLPGLSLSVKSLAHAHSRGISANRPSIMPVAHNLNYELNLPRSFSLPLSVKVLREFPPSLSALE